MCTETGIKDVYWGVQGACPRRAVTHAGGTAERSERRAVGMGLKLISISAGKPHSMFLAGDTATSFIPYNPSIYQSSFSQWSLKDALCQSLLSR